ncbi:MAG: alpha-glucoside transport system permease protein [Acidimicrobiaceae bacterium]|jgi:alpha-glucoside transport system permease protein|nr:MAG: alpha-glucoside transport system permease protein [Acidimicrobiaceae bacterium]
MFEILKSLLTVGIGIFGFLAALGALYWLASRLPEPWRERARVAVFVGPALVLLFGLVIPALINLRYSFNDRNDEWYGLQNYLDVFTNDDNLIVLRNTLWWGLSVTIASTVIGIVIARFADRMRGEPVAKALIFLPTAISMVGAGVIWNFIYSPKQYGLLNSVWQLLPGEQKTQFWLQDNEFFSLKSSFVPGLNTFFIMVVVIWIQAGFATVVISAALKGVPDDLVEAAKIDGASDRQAFYKVVLPYVKGTIITVATTTTIAVLKIFDIIQTMGKGGAFDTSTIANEMYEQGFPQNNEGLGAAWAVLLFLAVAPIVFINARNQRAMREGR